MPVPLFPPWTNSSTHPELRHTCTTSSGLGQNVLYSVSLSSHTPSHMSHMRICPLQFFLINLFVTVHLCPGVWLCVSLYVCTYSRMDTHTHTHTVISAAAEPATRGNGELWEECDLTWLHRSGLHMEQAHSWQMKKGPVQLRFRCQFMNMSLYINNSYWGLSRGYNIYIYIMTGTSFKISCIMCLLLSLNVNKAWTQDFLLLQNSLWPQMFCSLAWWLKQKHTFILH